MSKDKTDDNPRRLALAASVCIFDLKHGELAGERSACLGVDIQALAGTPSGERLWVDYSSKDDDPFGLPLALLALGFLAPSVIGRGQNMRISHDLEDSRIILACEPANTNGPDRREIPPSAASVASSKITPEVIEAGATSILREPGVAELGVFFSARDLAVKVYRAMQCERPRPRKFPPRNCAAREKRRGTI